MVKDLHWNSALLLEAFPGVGIGDFVALEALACTLSNEGIAPFAAEDETRKYLESPQVVFFGLCFQKYAPHLGQRSRVKPNFSKMCVA